MESGGRGGAAHRPQTTQGRSRHEAGAFGLSQLGDRCAEPRYAIVVTAAVAIAASRPRAGAVGRFARAGNGRLGSGYAAAGAARPRSDSSAEPAPPGLGLT